MIHAISILLTIAIPTFNRSEYLGETLDRLITQLPRESVGRIEILISDNASTDGTEELCRSYVRCHSGIVRYVRHLKNQGYDRNLDSLFGNALGHFVLLVGDDDYPLPGALSSLCAILQGGSGEIPWLVFCYHKLIDGITGEQRELTEDFFRPPSGVAPGPMYFKSGVDLLRQIDAPLNGGLTGTVFRREAWLASDRARFIGTNFLQLAVAYQVAARNLVCVDYRPLFAVRTYNDHRWPSNGELYFGLLKAGQPLYENYPADITDRFRQRNVWAVRRAIVSYRGAAPADRQLARVIRDSLDKSRMDYWLIDLPLLVIPGQIFSLVQMVRRVLRLNKS